MIDSPYTKRLLMVVALLMCASVPAHAGPDFKAGLMFTNHVSHCNGCNEFHPYVNLVFDTPIDNLTWSVGGYYNSQYKLSGTLGVEYAKDWWFVGGGVASGYSYAPVVPMFRAGIRWGDVDVFAFPSFDGKKPALGVGVGINF